MARVQAPLPTFPSPTLQYDPTSESQYRQTVQRAFQEVVGFITGGKQGSVTLGLGDNDDYSIGPVLDFIRVTANAGASALTGFAGGKAGRRLIIVNVSANTLTLEHDRTSALTNRIITATGGDLTLAQNDVAELYYDEISARWRVIGTSV